MPDDQEVIDQLSALGRGMVDNFNQNDEHRGGKKGTILEGGYCHGVCLDWCRRVLQGGRASFGPNPKKKADQGYDYNAKRQQQAKRQGFAWASFNTIQDRSLTATNAKKAQNKKDYDAAYEGYLGEKKELLAVRTKLMNDYNANSHLGEAHVVQIRYGAELLKVFPNLRTGAPTALSVKALLVMFETLQERSNALASPVQAAPLAKADMDQRTWTAFSTLMDSKLPKGKSFAGVSLIHLHPTKSFGSMSAAVASVTQPKPEDFCSGRAMIVGIDMRTRKGDVGHAVAIHWRPNDIYVLLDPNYGMFVYEQLAGPQSVAAALNYLFGTVYPAYPGVHEVLDDIDYGIYAKRDG